MECSDLIKLKSEVDELNLYYHALKSREDELNNILYANNLLDNISSEKKSDIEEMNEYIEKNEYLNTFKWMGIYIVFSFLLVIFKNLEIPKALYYILFACNIGNYSYQILWYKSIARKKYKKKHKKTINLDEVKREYDSIKIKIEKTKKKIYDKSLEYDGLVGELNEEEYNDYLEYLNTYIYEMLEDSVDKLSEAELIAFNETDNEKSYRLQEK